MLAGLALLGQLNAALVELVRPPVRPCLECVGTVCLICFVSFSGGAVEVGDAAGWGAHAHLAG